MKLLPFSKRRRTSPPRPPGGGGPRPPDERPSDAEIRHALGEIAKTLVDFSDVILAIELEIDVLHERTTRQNQYILTIVQALLRSGVEIPLTTKEPRAPSAPDSDKEKGPWGDSEP